MTEVRSKTQWKDEWGVGEGEDKLGGELRGWPVPRRSHLAPSKSDATGAVESRGVVVTVGDGQRPLRCRLCTACCCLCSGVARGERAR
jgi:hypothetical protein